MRTFVSLAIAIVTAFTMVGESDAWIVTGLGPRVAALPGGDVIALGHFAPDVVRLDALTGRPLWEVSVSGARALALHPGSDPIVAGASFAARLDQATGAERWRTDIPPPASAGFDELVLDGAGDVIGGEYGDDGVAKFDGVTGALRWHQFTGIRVTALAVDGAGDVLAAGWVELNPSGTDAIVVKLAGATGAELWRYVAHGDVPAGINIARDVEVDADRDVFVYGVLHVAAVGTDAILLAKLDADDGSELWRSGATERGPGYAIVVDGVGDVYAVRSVPSEIVKRAGATGAEIWRGSGPERWFLISAYDAGRLLAWAGGFGIVSLVSRDTGQVFWSQSVAMELPTAVPAGGNAVAGGADDLRNFGMVVRFAPELRGQQLRFIDSFGNPAARTLRVRSKDPLIHASVIPSSVGAPTLGGAVLELRNPTTGETATIALPAAHWRFRQSSRPGVQVYTYHDLHQESGPCTKAVIETGRKIDVRCKGGGITFTLDEGSQTALAVKLTTDSFSHCMLFDGTSVVDDRPASAAGKGLFKAQDSAAPVACS